MADATLSRKPVHCGRWAVAAAMAACSWLAAACTSCFETGTPVATPAGDRGIETLAPGDVVWSWHAGSGGLVARRVLSVHATWAFGVRTLATAHGRLTGVTAEHPLAAGSTSTWQDAGGFAVGDALVVLRGGEVRSETVLRAGPTSAWPWPQRVYNLTVEGPEHTFFAGGILVHNKEVPLEVDPEHEPTVFDPRTATAEASLSGLGAGEQEVAFEVYRPVGTTWTVQRLQEVKAAARVVRTDGKPAGRTVTLEPMPGRPHARRLTVRGLLEPPGSLVLGLAGIPSAFEHLPKQDWSTAVGRYGMPAIGPADELRQPTRILRTAGACLHATRLQPIDPADPDTSWDVLFSEPLPADVTGLTLPAWREASQVKDPPPDTFVAAQRTSARVLRLQPPPGAMTAEALRVSLAGVPDLAGQFDGTWSCAKAPHTLFLWLVKGTQTLVQPPVFLGASGGEAP